MCSNSNSQKLKNSFDEISGCPSLESLLDDNDFLIDDNHINIFDESYKQDIVICLNTNRLETKWETDNEDTLNASFKSKSNFRIT